MWRTIQKENFKSKKYFSTSLKNERKVKNLKNSRRMFQAVW